jgi:hypothetical protein
MTPTTSSAAVKKTTSLNKRKHTERNPKRFDYILAELQTIKDYEDTTMDFSRYNTLEEHMQLLDESNSLKGQSKNNHKLVANV